MQSADSLNFPQPQITLNSNAKSYSNQKGPLVNVKSKDYLNRACVFLSTNPIISSNIANAKNPGGLRGEVINPICTRAALLLRSAGQVRLNFTCIQSDL